MAPSLIGQANRLIPEIEDYSKVLSEMPRATRIIALGEFYFISRGFDLIRFTEYELVDSAYERCIVGECLESCDPDYQEQEVKRLKRAGYTPLEIGAEIESYKLHVGQPVQTVFRVAYCEFPIKDKSGIKVSAKQIRGVFTHADYMGLGIASFAYLYLVDKYQYLVCDTLQTVKGATLWAVSMRKHGLVEIYDTKNENFIEELGEDACGVSGFIPWDIGKSDGGQMRRREEWGTNKINLTPGACTHIVNILSKRSMNQ